MATNHGVFGGCMPSGEQGMKEQILALVPK